MAHDDERPFALDGPHRLVVAQIEAGGTTAVGSEI